MKKLFALLLALALTVSLAACGGDDPAPSTGDPGTATPDVVDNETPMYSFVFGDKRVDVNEDMTLALANLGEPQTYFEAESCAFDGLDKTYTYSGFTITTRPEDGKDYIQSILLTDDSVTTAKGIYIGSARDEVIASYGETDDSLPTLLSYTSAGTTLNFILDGDTVVSIEYLPAA